MSERYGLATESGNLRDPADRRSDCDYLKAAAWSDRELGSKLVRLYVANDVSMFPAVMQSWLAYVTKRSAKMGWGLAPEQIHRVAHASLMRWLVPTCPACLGRKFKLLADGEGGREVLSDAVCDACNGTGERIIESDPSLMAATRDCVVSLSRLYASASGRMRNLLR